MKYHITLNLNKEWVIREHNKDHVLFRSRFRNICEKAGNTLVTKYGDVVVVHKADGTIDYEMGPWAPVKIIDSTESIKSISGINSSA